MVKSYSNHDSILKHETRLEVLKKASKIFDKQGELRALTLPSSNFIFEQLMLDEYGKRCKLVCVEREWDVYKEVVDRTIMFDNVTMINDDVFNYIEKQNDEVFNFVWLDLCGNLSQSNIMDFLQFIQSDKLADNSQVCITLMGAREARGKQMSEFHGCDLDNIRYGMFPTLVQEYAKQVGRKCNVEPIIHYKSELQKKSCPMNVYSFRFH